MDTAQSQIMRRAAEDAVLEAKEDRTVRFLASSTAQDRHGTVILPEGIRTDNYAKNPVVIWAHQTGGIFSGCDPDDVIGQALSWEVTERGFEVTVRLLPGELNPKAERIYRLVQAGALRAMSIGFQPVRAHVEGDTTIYDEIDLLEVSIVIVPSNPDALALRSLIGGPMKERSQTRADDPDKDKGEEDKTREEDKDKDKGEEDKTREEDKGEEDREHDEPDGDEPKDVDEARAVIRELKRAVKHLNKELAAVREGAPKAEAKVRSDVDRWLQEGRIQEGRREYWLAEHRAGRAWSVLQHIAPRTYSPAQERLSSGRVGTPATPPPAPERGSEVKKVVAQKMDEVQQRVAGLSRSARG